MTDRADDFQAVLERAAKLCGEPIDHETTQHVGLLLAAREREAAKLIAGRDADLDKVLRIDGAIKDHLPKPQRKIEVEVIRSFDNCPHCGKDLDAKPLPPVPQQIDGTATEIDPNAKPLPPPQPQAQARANDQPAVTPQPETKRAPAPAPEPPYYTPPADAGVGGGVCIIGTSPRDALGPRWPNPSRF